MKRFCIVQGTHLVLHDYNDNDDRQYQCKNNDDGMDAGPDEEDENDEKFIIVPGMPLHAMSDLFQMSRQQEQNENDELNYDEFIMKYKRELEPVQILASRNHYDNDHYLVELDHSLQRGDFGVHIAYVLVEEVSESSFDHEKLPLISSTVKVQRSMINDNAIIVVDTRNENILLEVKNVGSILIFDFLGNGMDQIMMFPKLSDILENKCVDFESMSKLLCISLSKVVLTDGTCVMASLNGDRELYSIVSLSGQTLKMESVIDLNISPMKINDMNEDRKVLDRVDGNMKAEAEDNMKVDKNEALEKIQKGLEARLISEIRLGEKARQAHSKMEEAARNSQDLLFQFIRSNGWILPSRSQDQYVKGKFIPVFGPNKNESIALDENHKEGSRNVEKTLAKVPLQLIGISWKSQSGKQSLTIEIDLLAQEPKKSVPFKNDSKSQYIATHFKNIFISCSITSIEDKVGVETESGCIPLLIPGQSAAIRADVSFAENLLLQNDYLIVAIDAHWMEFQSPIPFIDEIQVSAKAIQQGMSLGMIKIPMEAIVLECPSTYVSFAQDHRPSCLFYFRKPKVINITPPSSGYASLKIMCKRIEKESNGSVSIKIEEESNEISIFADNAHLRCATLRLFLDELPDDVNIKEDVCMSEISRHALLDAISSELKIMEKHRKLKQEMVNVDVLNELMQYQIRTDEVAAMVRQS